MISRVQLLQSTVKLYQRLNISSRSGSAISRVVNPTSTSSSSSTLTSLSSSSSTLSTYSSSRYYTKSNNNNKDEDNSTTSQELKELLDRKGVNVSEDLIKYEPSNRDPKAIRELVNDKGNWLAALVSYAKTDAFSIHTSFALYDAIAIQTSNPALYKTMGLPLTVRSWFAATLLHVWMVFVRLRKEKDVNTLSTDLYDRFWEDLEKRIVRGGINHRFANKYLKEFYTNYLGGVISYDEGLFDDAVLADALWRNLLAMEDNTTAAQLDLIVQYVRRELNHLDNLPKVGEGEISFGDITTLQKDKQQPQQQQK
ncbi:hypothetical protein DFA_04964 [Cavenderia fasciculata]|uniref:Ubiquinol-cytochrome c chaperone domain-containing protein n=1 Tax=Cavenderia fasciculata TaxID=261658 RepID=F4PMN7_CACFS|nr:uncharacterized protein DFA_04964 [Cavenderia fasciculata]EGG22834.1 hypothetical protein DFA_04964 [Cavenderia fasciculata]|eukprot:XP_004360685.1 hypothetical protein DFA_04964 [Cavenderia fasciculata]